MSENIREVNVDGVTVLVKKPGRKELNDSQIVYNKAWRKALDGGAIIRAKLNEYLTEQGVWSETQQKQYENFIKQINDRELILKKGGIPLKNDSLGTNRTAAFSRSSPAARSQASSYCAFNTTVRVSAPGIFIDSM